MKNEIIIIADAESDISRFLASFISDDFKVVCCDNSGETLDDRITAARTFGAINKHHSIILPVETDNCGRYGNWMEEGSDKFNHFIDATRYGNESHIRSGGLGT